MQNFEKNLKVILSNNASFNLYMFHGGTNFGFLNGANRNYTVSSPVEQGLPGYQPTVCFIHPPSEHLSIKEGRSEIEQQGPSRETEGVDHQTASTSKNWISKSG